MILEGLIHDLRLLLDKKIMVLQHPVAPSNTQVLVKTLNNYITRALVLADDSTSNLIYEQLVSAFSAFLELSILVKGAAKMLIWLDNKNNWKESFAINSDPSLLHADIFWSLIKALYLIEDAIQHKISLGSESIISSLQHIVICFASLFEKAELYPECLLNLLRQIPVNLDYGNNNGDGIKPLDSWKAKDKFVKFFVVDKY